MSHYDEFRDELTYEEVKHAKDMEQAVRESRESYEDYMRRRSAEEDAKEQRLPKARSVFDVLQPNTLDEIARDALEWHRDNIAKELANFYYHGGRMHPEDVAYYTELLPKFNAVCKFFGIEAKGYNDFE